MRNVSQLVKHTAFRELIVFLMSDTYRRATHA